MTVKKIYPRLGFFWHLRSSFACTLTKTCATKGKVCYFSVFPFRILGEIVVYDLLSTDVRRFVRDRSCYCVTSRNITAT